MSYSMQQGQQAGLAVQQVAQNSVNMAGASGPGLIEQARNGINACHALLDGLHKFADQYVGIRGVEGSTNAPAPVPNGVVEELRDVIFNLEARLNALCGRLAIL